MIEPRYTIEEIRSLEQEVDVYEFSDKTLDLINSIAKQVGAPGYIKTPTFKRCKNKKCKTNC